MAMRMSITVLMAIVSEPTHQTGAGQKRSGVFSMFICLCVFWFLL